MGKLRMLSFEMLRSRDAATVGDQPKASAPSTLSLAAAYSAVASGQHRVNQEHVRIREIEGFEVVAHRFKRRLIPVSAHVAEPCLRRTSNIASAIPDRREE